MLILINAISLNAIFFYQDCFNESVEYRQTFIFGGIQISFVFLIEKIDKNSCIAFIHFLAVFRNQSISISHGIKQTHMITVSE